MPYLRVVHGRAPDVLRPAARSPTRCSSAAGRPTPLLLDACWDALPPGGRLVVNAVTLESEAVLADWHGPVRRRRWSGWPCSAPSPVGGFTGWKPAMPVTIWSGTR